MVMSSEIINKIAPFMLLKLMIVLPCKLVMRCHILSSASIAAAWRELPGSKD